MRILVIPYSDLEFQSLHCAKNFWSDFYYYDFQKANSNFFLAQLLNFLYNKNYNMSRMRLGREISIAPNNPCESEKSIKKADNFTTFREKRDFTSKFLEKMVFGQFFSHCFRAHPAADWKFIFLWNLANSTPLIKSSLYYNEWHWPK